MGPSFATGLYGLDGGSHLLCIIYGVSLETPATVRQSEPILIKRGAGASGLGSP